MIPNKTCDNFMIQIAIFLLKSHNLVKRPTCLRTKVWLKRHSWELSEFFVEDGIERTFTGIIHTQDLQNYITVSLFCLFCIYVLSLRFRKLS